MSTYAVLALHVRAKWSPKCIYRLPSASDTPHRSCMQLAKSSRLEPGPNSHQYTLATWFVRTDCWRWLKSGEKKSNLSAFTWDWSHCTRMECVFFLPIYPRSQKRSSCRTKRRKSPQIQHPCWIVPLWGPWSLRRMWMPGLQQLNRVNRKNLVSKKAEMLGEHGRVALYYGSFECNQKA